PRRCRRPRRRRADAAADAGSRLPPPPPGARKPARRVRPAADLCYEEPVETVTADARSFMFVFPGQGSQYRGMGQDLCVAFDTARRIYRQASEALGYDMTELSFRDPEDKLGLTAYTQPALLTHSIACLEVFR